ncbi:hypothetical protein ACXU4B_00915 [Dyella soli]|uniref:Uncharacterized protein n=1 Tax=Dyella soli TaxID=522319 RepID=A0A4R0YTP4_9GAMM|nr:hypothetical protein [Dyella soli]TCI09640.1 hypothetical protein EZM97_11790 [Dyella soli]
MSNRIPLITRRPRIAMAGATGRVGSALTGPRAWTMRQIAEHLSILLGRTVTYGHQSREQQRAALSADGLAPLVADLLVGLDQMFRESALEETTSTVEALTGKPPRTLQQWLVENIEIFRNDARP